jgi:hypothetical protein
MMKTAMTKRQQMRVMLLALVCLVFANPVSGHEQKAALTRIVFNPNTDNLEVMHRFFLHDAEHAARQLFGESINMIESAEDRELFASYVRNRFSITAISNSGEETVLKLNYVGQETDRRFVWIYQEISAPDDVIAMTIFNTVLRDVWSDQSNLINIEKGDAIYSLNLDGSRESGSVDLE